mmetsp:Transcript_18504/g.33409  ORF Transcript_18504/g.33409 Transcript_18504/m.33409 type:complete len:420 (+) Transcript_18504:6-1265(+)
MMRRFFRSSALLLQDITLVSKSLKVTLQDTTAFAQLVEAVKTQMKLELPQFVSFNKEFDYLSVVDDKSLDICLKLALPNALMLNVKGKPIKPEQPPKQPDFEEQHVSFMYSQANSQMEAGDFEKAAETYTQCVDKLSSNPDKLGDVLACKAGIAQCLLHLNKTQEARLLLESILQQYSEAGFPKDSRHKFIRLFLAETLLRQSKLPEAIQAYEELESSLSEAPEPLYERVCRGLGDLYASQGRFDEAQIVLRKGLAYSKSQEERTLAIANISALLGIVETIRNNLQESELLLTEAISIFTEKAGEDSLDAMELTFRLATCVLKQGRVEASKELFEGLVSKYRSTQRPKDSIFSNYLLGYAETLYILDQLEGAKTVAQEVLEIERAVQGRFLPEAESCLAAIADKEKESKRRASGVSYKN